jgi:rSAM/selenodomain-associated transferase 2
MTTPRTTVSISVVIPALDEAALIGATLDDLALISPRVECIVVDGGSRDDTVAIARERGVHVVHASPGRGTQMAVGAREATGDVLWFLHADTRPPTGAVASITRALADERAVGGNFNLIFDGDSRAARFLTWLYPRLRWLGLCYGDSAFFVRRDVYDAVGGFRPLPIFEDLDLLRRLKRAGRFVRADDTVVTSSRRFASRSFALTFARWASLQALYWLGVSPNRLGTFYAHIRAAGRR